MSSKEKKTALVTGASSRMGKAIAKRLIEDGYQVYATARQVDRMDDLAQLGARTLRMDIRSRSGKLGREGRGSSTSAYVGSRPAPSRRAWRQ